MASSEEKKSDAVTVIAEEETAKADTIPEQKKASFPWFVLVILAALGITTEEIVRRKSVKASNNASDNANQ